MKVYFDNAATTKPYPSVISEMTYYLEGYYENPSGEYGDAVDIKGDIEFFREHIADTINVKPDEIYFTSGGSEADNWAIRGVAEASWKKHIITSAIEHKAVLNTCHYLEEHGYEVTYIEPDEKGIILPKDVEAAIRRDTALVSIMCANNEIGTIEPVEMIADICHKHGVPFHTDAVQAYLHTPIDASKFDLMSVSAHKFHGPKGVGFLYVKEGTPIIPLIYGGHQEYGLRAGTENVPGIAGMAEAAKIGYANLNDHIEYIVGLRDYFLERVLDEISGVTLNGSYVSRLCNNLSLSFQGIKSEVAVGLLDMNEIYCSAGSACNNGEGLPSHVLLALGKSPKYANETLRFTFSEMNTIDEVDYCIEQLKFVVNSLRAVKDPADCEGMDDGE